MSGNPEYNEREIPQQLQRSLRLAFGPVWKVASAASLQTQPIPEYKRRTVGSICKEEKQAV